MEEFLIPFAAHGNIFSRKCVRPADILSELCQGRSGVIFQKQERRDVPEFGDELRYGDHLLDIALRDRKVQFKKVHKALEYIPELSECLIPLGSHALCLASQLFRIEGPLDG